MKKAAKWLIRGYILTCFSAFQYKKKKLQKEKGKLPAYIRVTSHLFAFLASLPVFWSEKEKNHQYKRLIHQKLILNKVKGEDYFTFRFIVPD